MVLQFPRFVPHPLLRGGNRQTLAAAWAPGSAQPYRATSFHVSLDDGDHLVVHDDCPDHWRSGDDLVILCHGLGGSHMSPYMQRMQHHFNLRGVRTWRVDLRGFGDSVTYSTLPGHAGRSEDLLQVVRTAEQLHRGSPLALLGFSMGGNIVLKMLGELGADARPPLRCAIAVAPPVNLMACATNMKQGLNRYFSKRFISRLMHNLRELRKTCPDLLGGLSLSPNPTHIMEFDERFTAPLSGFRNAREYYLRCSSAPLLPAIQLPTLILTSADDPVIPSPIFAGLRASPCVQMHHAEGGGHVGFFSAKGDDPNRCWMDWRLLDWLALHGIGVARSGLLLPTEVGPSTQRLPLSRNSALSQCQLSSSDDCSGRTL